MPRMLAVSSRLLILLSATLVLAAPALASDCDALSANFKSAIAEKSIAKVKDAMAAIADDSACNFDIDAYPTDHGWVARVTRLDETGVDEVVFMADLGFESQIDEGFVGLFENRFVVGDAADVDEAVFLGADGRPIGQVEHFAGDITRRADALSRLALLDEISVLGESAGVEEKRDAVPLANRSDFAEVG